MEQNIILIEKTARYYMLGSSQLPVSHIWFVCHGYGHLAEYFIQKFRLLDKPGNLVVAPEGLHRYYLNGVNGRVGASWMTKEDRLNDINDYVRYLDKLYELILGRFGGRGTKVTVLGFSQGAATASRWAAYGRSSVNHLILWSGSFPPDMDFKVDSARLSATKILLVAGDKDEFVSQAHIRAQEHILKESRLTYSLVNFRGGHEISESVLQDISQNLL
jgi:predicted esterase